MHPTTDLGFFYIAFVSLQRSVVAVYAAVPRSNEPRDLVRNENYASLAYSDSAYFFIEVGHCRVTSIDKAMDRRFTTQQAL